MKLAAVIAFLLLGPLALTTQDKPAGQAPNKLTVGANLVLVPVVVTDKHGEHLTGLTQADFEMREDGKEEEIASFEEVKAESSAVERQVLAPNKFSNQLNIGRPKKLEIILLDLLNTPLFGRAEARRGLIEFLSKSSDPETLTALLVLRADGVNMVHNFTADPAVLVEAIRRLQAPAASRDNPALYTLGGDTDAELQQLRRIAAGQAIAASMGAHASPAQGIALLRADEANADLSRQNQEGAMTLECLQQIARYFAAVPGRKSLFWASTGFQFNIGSMEREAQGATLDVWQQTMRMLQDANIAIYPVDLAGVGLNGEGDARTHGNIPSPNGGAAAMQAGRLGDPTMAKHLTMDTVATMTGGQALYNFNDSDKLFRRARQDSGQYYMLAYYTKSSEKAGWRKLSVRVHREGVSIRARSGFFFSNTARDSDAARQSDELRALTSALEATSLPISGRWENNEAAGDQRKVHFSLLLPPGSVLIDDEHEHSVNIDFLVYAWNSEGKEAAKIGQRLAHKLSAQELADARSRGITYQNVFTLPPGQYDVHMVVRDNLTGKLGSVVTQLKVE